MTTEEPRWSRSGKQFFNYVAVSSAHYGEFVPLELALLGHTPERRRLEGARPVGRAVACWSVVAAYTSAQVGPTAGAVAAGGHVVQRRAMAIRVGPIVDDAARIAGQRVHRGDNGRSHARAAEHQPA